MPQLPGSAEHDTGHAEIERTGPDLEIVHDIIEIAEQPDHQCHPGGMFEEWHPLARARKHAFGQEQWPCRVEHCAGQAVEADVGRPQCELHHRSGTDRQEGQRKQHEMPAPPVKQPDAEKAGREKQQQCRRNELQGFRPRPLPASNAARHLHGTGKQDDSAAPKSRDIRALPISLGRDLFRRRLDRLTGTAEGDLRQHEGDDSGQRDACHHRQRRAVEEQSGDAHRHRTDGEMQRAHQR